MIYKILHYTESELRYSGRVSFSCSTSGTRHSSYIPDDTSRIRKGWGCNYDKRSISVVMRDTDIPLAVVLNKNIIL